MAREPLRDSEIDKFRSMMKPRKSTANNSIQQMMDEGFGIVTGVGQTALEIIKERYTGDFRTFFTMLSAKYDRYKRATAEIKRVRGVFSKISSLVILIDKILSTNDIVKAREYGLKLLDMVTELDDEFIFFTDATKISETLSENFEQIARTTGISLEDLDSAQVLFLKKTKEITKPVSKGKQFLDLVKTVAGTVGKAATLDMFGIGPYQRRERNKQKIMAERLDENAFGVAGTNIGAETQRQEIEPEDTSIMGAVDRAGEGRRGGDIETGLFNFFNGKAMKAKWTKKMLESSHGGSGSGIDTEDAGGGGIRNFGSMINLATVAIVAFTYAATLAVDWLSKQKFISDMMGGDAHTHLQKEASKATLAQARGTGHLTPEHVRALQIRAKDESIGAKAATQMAWEQMHGIILDENLNVVSKPGDDIEREAHIQERNEQEAMQQARGNEMSVEESIKKFGSKESVNEDSMLNDIPLVTAGSDSNYRMSIEDLSISIRELNDNIKNMDTKSTPPPAGTNVNTIKNPLLDSIGAGSIVPD